MNEHMEYTYNNSAYYSEVNDFDDEYHKEDVEYTSDDEIMNNLLQKIRTHNRRYTNFAEWCEVKEEYIEYTERLIAKYGGKKRFNFLATIGMVDDYIPFCPMLKKTKKNRMYIKSKDLPYVPVFEGMSELVDKVIIDTEVLEKLNLRVDLKVTKCNLDISELIGVDNIKKNINDDLSRIETYYKGRTTKLTSRRKREHEIELRKEIVAPKENEGICFSKMMKKYEFNMNHGLYIEDIEKDVERIKYRDVAITSADETEIEVFNSLKELGLNIGRNIVSKKSMKVIRRVQGEVKKKKPKKKKGKHIKRDKDMKKILKKGYSTYDSFQTDLQKLSKNILSTQWE